jgi:hypothetical protein
MSGLDLPRAKDVLFLPKTSEIKRKPPMRRHGLRMPFLTAVLLLPAVLTAAAHDGPRDSTFPAPWGAQTFGDAPSLLEMLSDISLIGPSDLGVTTDLATNRLEGVFTIQENGLGGERIFDPADFGLEGPGADQFEIDASDCTGALGSGQACQVRVRLRADAAEGRHSAILIDRVTGRQASFSGAFLPPPPQGEAIFATPGTFTFVVPARVTAMTVEVWGGGGGSPINHCFGQKCSCCSGGGGGGGYAASTLTVEPGQTYAITVGGGGLASDPGWPRPNAVYIGHAMRANAPQNGGQSSVVGPGGTLGATGGQTPNATNAGGAPGSGWGGQVNRTGTPGTPAYSGRKGIYQNGTGGRPPVPNPWNAGTGANGSLGGGNHPGKPGLVVIRWGQ